MLLGISSQLAYTFWKRKVDVGSRKWFLGEFSRFPDSCNCSEGLVISLTPGHQRRVLEVSGNLLLVLLVITGQMHNTRQNHASWTSLCVGSPEGLGKMHIAFQSAAGRFSGAAFPAPC